MDYSSLFDGGCGCGSSHSDDATPATDAPEDTSPTEESSEG